MNTLVFDIETVPDTDLGRRLYDLADIDDEAVAKIMFFKQKQLRGSDFLPLPQHRILVISAVLRTRDDVHVFSLGNANSDEREVVQRFFDGLDKYVPELVSWNGSGFDLPVLHYRALKHSVVAARYWEIGDSDREFRFNNYLNRFHWRHIDLMDVLAGYQLSGRSSLEQVALLLGFPGKLGMSGEKVWDYYRQGRIAEIRNYCETDALNTYLIYLRLQLMRGVLDHAGYDRELEALKDKLAAAGEAHLNEFLNAWSAADDGD